MANNETPTTRIVRLLSEIRTTVEELAHHADAGSTIRAMFGTNGAARSTVTKKHLLRSAKASPAAATKPKRQAKKQKKARGQAQRSMSKDASGDQIVELVVNAKNGMSAREIGAVLGLKAAALGYQLKKLLAAKRLRKEGKTNKTVYLSPSA